MNTQPEKLIWLAAAPTHSRTQTRPPGEVVASHYANGWPLQSGIQEALRLRRLGGADRARRPRTRRNHWGREGRGGFSVAQSESTFEAFGFHLWVSVLSPGPKSLSFHDGADCRFPEWKAGGWLEGTYQSFVLRVSRCVWRIPGWVLHI